MSELKYLGQRVRIIKNELDTRAVGLTGTVYESVDGYCLQFDRPLPEWCVGEEWESNGGCIVSYNRDYDEDILDQDMAKKVEIIDASVPNHQGSGVGQSILQIALQESTMSILEDSVESIAWVDNQGNTDSISKHESRPILFAIDYNEYLEGSRAHPDPALYNISYSHAGLIADVVQEARAFSESFQEPFSISSVKIPEII